MKLHGHTLVIDNYDSFTWNLVHLLRVCGDDPVVLRHDELSGIDSPSRLIISPGPRHPDDCGQTPQVLADCLEREIPVLGVCLGMQCIGAAFGMSVRRAVRPLHGKVSSVHHDGEGVFRDVSNPFTAARYHSLALDAAELPEELQVTAWTRECGVRTIMGLRHRVLPVEGVQFHPESFLTPEGRRMVENFLSWTPDRLSQLDCAKR